MKERFDLTLEDLTRESAGPLPVAPKLLSREVVDLRLGAPDDGVNGRVVGGVSSNSGLPGGSGNAKRRDG